MSTEYMTKKEAAEYMRIGSATLERLMRQGLPYIKLQRRVLFRRPDVDKWLESRIVTKGAK